MAESHFINRIVWMDVPVIELIRARDFYAGVLAIQVSIEKFEQVEFALLDHEQGNGGCLIIDPDNVGVQGPMVYMNVNGRLADAVQQVNTLGGASSAGYT